MALLTTQRRGEVAFDTLQPASQDVESRAAAVETRRVPSTTLVPSDGRSEAARVERNSPRRRLINIARRLAGMTTKPVPKPVVRVVTTTARTSFAAAAPVVEKAVSQAVAAAGPVVEKAVGQAVEAMLPMAERLAAPVMDRIPDALSGPLTKQVARLAGPATGRAVRRGFAVRMDGHDVATTPDDLSLAFPKASDRLMICIPAAGEDEKVWAKGAERMGGSYADRVATVNNWTPVMLRNDSGEVMDAGVALGALIQQVIDNWPVPVSRVVLLAHGDGGLAVRTGSAIRPMGDRPWTSLVTEVIALGTPHLAVTDLATFVGARLEANLSGIVHLDERVTDLPLLDRAAYLLIGDDVTTQDNPFGKALGGAMKVGRRGTTRRVVEIFPGAERFVLSTTQEPLVNHRSIHDALLRWLR